jgi:S-DNA-T family DNA segregation ATPase FtsK/SpoIIIE
MDLFEKKKKLLAQYITHFEQRIIEKQEEAKSFSENSLAEEKALWRDIPYCYWTNLQDVDWGQHDFSQEFLPEDIYIYKFRTKRGQTFAPLVVPFMRNNSTLIIGGNVPEGLYPAGFARMTTDTLILRLCTMLPYSSQFCLLDPSGLGAAFPYQSSLPATRDVTLGTSRVLEDIVTDIVRINTKVLNLKTPRLADVAPEMRSGEKFEFIVAANFPEGYDRRSIELLAKIANSGGNAGKYVILKHNPDAEFPSGVSLELFKKLQNGVGDSALFNYRHGRKSVYVPEKSYETLSNGLENIKTRKPKATSLSFEHLVDTDNTDAWWAGDSSREISASIGGAGANKDGLKIWFGESQDGRSSSHGIVGAQTGMGKTSLYQVFIVNLACKYSPEELQFYLVDGKFGVGFECFSQLPHAKIVSLHTSPELARSVLEELVDEMERRNQLFKSKKVENLFQYRQLQDSNTRQKLPRLMLIVDEFQILFEDDQDMRGSVLLKKLAEQGRSVGIHMLLGSQRIENNIPQNEDAITANMQTHIAMSMKAENVKASQKFGPEGKKMISACTLSGQVVINDQGGSDGANVAGRVALLNKTPREQLVNDLQDKWRTSPVEKPLLGQIVLDGIEQPSLLDNTQLKTLFNLYSIRPDAKQWRKFAELPVYSGGLGECQWLSVEKPVALWLGKENNIHGQAHIVLKRDDCQHVLLVGENRAARLGMLAFSLLQLMIMHSHEQYQVLVIDSSIKDSPDDSVIKSVIDSMPGVKKVYTDDSAQFIDYLEGVASDMEERKSMSNESLQQQPNIYIVINDAQRLREIASPDHSQENDNAAYSLVNNILKNGARLGIHLIMSFDDMYAVSKVMSRKEIEREFKHKIALQMDQRSSFDLLGDKNASKLQEKGNAPVYAIYRHLAKDVLFKPYCITSIREEDEVNSVSATIDQIVEMTSTWDHS